MPTPALIDFDKLLAPISDDAPCGGDIREDSSPTSVYYRLKDARSAARAAERAMDADDESGGLLSDWRTILELSPGVLATQTKDLEVAAWYAEALLRSEGYAGLRDGFQLIAGLVENFWDGLYPLPDEDGIETRVAPLTGLNGESSDGALIQPLRKSVLFPGADKDFALWHYEQASELARVADAAKRQARIDSGAATMEALEAAVKSLPAGHFRTLLDDIDACAAAFAAMGDKLYEKAGHDAPPAGAIRNVLTAARDAVADLGRDKLAMADAQAANAAGGAAAAPSAGDAAVAGAAGFSVGGGATAQANVGGGVIASREDAFRVLLQIADFFRKTEPHSPISYTLEEVVRRGRLSLNDLLEELIQDETTRKFFLIASGIKPPETKKEDSSSSGW
jgi:type VI secretion system protein ImpA